MMDSSISDYNSKLKKYSTLSLHVETDIESSDLHIPKQTAQSDDDLGSEDNLQSHQNPTPITTTDGPMEHIKEMRIPDFRSEQPERYDEKTSYLSSNSTFLPTNNSSNTPSSNSHSNNWQNSNMRDNSFPYSNPKYIEHDLYTNNNHNHLNNSYYSGDNKQPFHSPPDLHYNNNSKFSTPMNDPRQYSLQHKSSKILNSSNFNQNSSLIDNYFPHKHDTQRYNNSDIFHYEKRKNHELSQRKSHSKYRSPSPSKNIESKPLSSGRRHRNHRNIVSFSSSEDDYPSSFSKDGRNSSSTKRSSLKINSKSHSSYRNIQQETSYNHERDSWQHSQQENFYDFEGGSKQQTYPSQHPKYHNELIDRSYNIRDHFNEQPHSSSQNDQNRELKGIIEKQSDEIDKLKQMVNQMFSNFGQSAHTPNKFLNTLPSVPNYPSTDGSNPYAMNSYSNLNYEEPKQEHMNSNYDFGDLETKEVVRNGKDYPPVVFEKYEPHPLLNTISESDAQQIRDINNIHVIPPDGLQTPKPISSFKLGIFPDFINKYVENMKFNNPTPIQMQSWPIIQQGFDVLGIAATGSGKTLAFMFPAFLHILRQAPLRPYDGPISLVLSPTRELALQITAVTKQLCNLKGDDIQSINVHGSYGWIGIALKKEYLSIVGKVDILVGSPGRIYGLINKVRLDLGRVSFLVLDEADCLFASDFQNLTKFIAKNVSPSRQTMMFSATWSNDVDETKKIVSVRPCFCISVGNKDLISPSLVESIENILYFSQYTELSLSEKISIISEEIAQTSKQALVFCETISDVLCVFAELNTSSPNIKLGHVYGGIKQTVRNITLRSFRTKKIKVLITTDNSSKSIDIPNIGLVINFDCPPKVDKYTHRIGRTRRAGRKVRYVTFAGPYHYHFIEKLKHHNPNFKVHQLY